MNCAPASRLFRLLIFLVSTALLCAGAAPKEKPRAVAKPASASTQSSAEDRPYLAAKPVPDASRPEPVATPAPLTLIYKLLKKVGTGTTEVDESETFHSGDLIRLRVQSNQDARLYIGLKASQGTWDVLLPDPNIMGGDNLIRKDDPLDVPINREDWFEFDDQPGQEHLFLVLSRTPVKDIEELIRVRPRTGWEPDRPEERERQYLVQNRSISSEVVEGLKSKSRGIRRGPVAANRPKKSLEEHTVYIENREPDGLIVIEVVLKHRE